MVLEAKPHRPKLNTVQSVVAGAFPTLAHLLHVPTADHSSWVVISPSSDQGSQETDNLDWVPITPVVVAPTRDFPMLPAVDLTRSSARLLGSLMSSFKSIPDSKTWPMTSNSIGLSSQQFDDNTTFRVRAQDLEHLWSALPGSGGTVRSLQWRRDTYSVSHESVILQVSGSLPDGEEDWWICLERFPEGDIATISRNPKLVTRRDSAVRAEMHFTNGLSFGYVLRVLDIIHDVSRHYFLIGANCWFYASVIVEMLNLHFGNKRSSVQWLEGKSLNYCDHHTTKELNHKQYHEINSRVRQMSKSVMQRPSTRNWTSVLMI